jgi:hypothetical protein
MTDMAMEHGNMKTKDKNTGTVANIVSLFSARRIKIFQIKAVQIGDNNIIGYFFNIVSMYHICV